MMFSEGSPIDIPSQPYSTLPETNQVLSMVFLALLMGIENPRPDVPSALGGYPGVDADNLTIDVDQSSARITSVDGRVGLKYSR